MKYENTNIEMLAEVADGMELSDELMEGVAGGGPRVRIPRNPVKTITNAVHTAKKVVEAIADALSPRKRPKDLPWVNPDQPDPRLPVPVAGE